MAIANSFLTIGAPLDFSTAVLRVTCNATTTDLTFPASGSITADRYYWLQGDAVADSSTDGGLGDLVRMLRTTLRTHSQGASFEVTCSATGYLTVTCSNSFQLLWAHANSTLDDAIFGFSGSTSSGTSTTAPLRASRQFFPGHPLTIGAPDRPQTVSASKTSVSGLIRRSWFAESKAVREFQWDLVDKSQIWIDYAGTETATCFESVWTDYLSKGYPFRYHADVADRSTYSLYRIEDEPVIEPDTRARGAQKWRVKFLGRRAED